MQRFLTALVGIPIVLVLLYFGGIPFAVFVAICIVMMIAELRKMFNLPVLNSNFVVTSVVSLLLIGGRILTDDSWFIPILILTILSVLSVSVFRKVHQGLVDVCVDFIAVFYIAFLFSFLVDIRLLANGLQAVFLLLVIIWVYDSGAYFFGIRYGKHKMAPLLSPKKSWEGLLGGLVITIAILLVINSMLKFLPWWGMLSLVVCTAIAAQVGDLVESFFKRQAGVKDSGNFLPGHGGFLDRFDSFLFAAPIYLVVYNFLMWVKLNG